MKTLRTFIITATLATVAATSAQAAPDQNGVFFKDPAIAGSGCKAGTVDYAITPDGQTLSILFDSYSAAPGNKTCNIAVPVHVPNGYQVSLMTADYRGYVQGSATLSRSYFFAGATGPSLRTPMSSGAGKEYTQRDSLITSSNSYAKCGEDVNLRVNSRIMTNNSKSSISLDSLDLQNGIVFKLQYRPC